MPTAAPSRRLIFSTVVIAVGLVIAHYLGMTKPVESVLQPLLTAVGRFGFRLTHSVSGEPRTASISERTIAELNQRISVLSAENAALRSTLNASRDAGEQLAFLQDRQLTGITARVFARSADPSLQVVAIDVGTSQGIDTGQAVIIGNGILIGKIQSASHNSSQVLLTTDNRSVMTAALADNAAAQGVIRGVRGLSLFMDLIPQSETLTAGQIAITSGTDPIIPPGLVIGELNRIEKQQGAVLQSATLRPLYTATRLDAVTVLTGLSQK